MRVRSGVALVAAFFLVGGITACTSKDSGKPNPTFAVTTETTAGTTSTTVASSESNPGSTTTTTGESGPGSPTTTTGESGPTADGPAADQGDCTRLFELYGAITGGAAGAFMGGAGEEQVKEFEAGIARLRDSVPEDLRDDITTVSDAYKAMAQALATSDPSDYLDPEYQQKIEDATADFDAPAVQAAADDLQTYFANNCRN